MRWPINNYMLWFIIEWCESRRLCVRELIYCLALMCASIYWVTILVLLSAFINFYKREDHIFLQLLINQSPILVFGMSPIKTMNFKLCCLLVLFSFSFLTCFQQSSFSTSYTLHQSYYRVTTLLAKNSDDINFRQKKSGVLWK